MEKVSEEKDYGNETQETKGEGQGCLLSTLTDNRSHTENDTERYQHLDCCQTHESGLCSFGGIHWLQINPISEGDGQDKLAASSVTTSSCITNPGLIRKGLSIMCPSSSISM